MKVGLTEGQHEKEPEKEEAARPVEEPHPGARRAHQDRDTRRERQSTPEQAARGEPVLQLEPAKKETFQDKVISPESPGEDRHIEDKDRIKSTSPSRSRRRQESRGLSRRHRDSGTDDSAKRKAPELAEGYNYPHNNGKSEETNEEI